MAANDDGDIKDSTVCSTRVACHAYAEAWVIVNSASCRRQAGLDAQGHMIIEVLTSFVVAYPPVLLTSLS